MITPIWSAILAAWMLREGLGAAKVAGLAVVFWVPFWSFRAAAWGPECSRCRRLAGIF